MSTITIIKHKKSWWIKGTSGILLFGAGISMVIEAGFYKHAHPTDWKWVLFGTISLIVLMTGLIVMIDSAKHKIYMEMQAE